MGKTLKESMAELQRVIRKQQEDFMKRVIKDFGGFDIPKGATILGAQVSIADDTKYKFTFADDMKDEKTPLGIPSETKWKEILKKIPDLKGQIIGGHTIIWGHTVKFHKETYPIKSVYGDILSENAVMKMSCSCGFAVDDVLPFVTETYTRRNNTGGKRIDFNKVEKVVLDHLPQPLVVEKMDYISFTQEWLEDLGQPKFLEHFFEVILNSGGILHSDFDTQSYFLVDDNMTDAGINELKEMLEGHEFGTKKVKVIKNG